MTCETCGAVVEDGASFCPECGNAVGGNKTVCKECGCSFDGDYCPICGAAADGVLEVEEEGATVAKVSSSNGTMKMLSRIFAFAGAAVALILMFFMGTRMVETELGMSVKTPGAKNIFWYFGDNFKQLTLFLDMADMNPEYFEAGEMLSAIFGSVFGFFIALATMVLVLVFGIIAIVKFAKSFSQENDSMKASFKVMLAYVLGATLLSAISLESYEGVMESGAVTLNGATIFGLVFCTIAIVGAFVFKLLANTSNVKGKIIGAACAIVSLVVLLIAAHTGFSYKYTSVWSGEAKYNMSAFSALGNVIDDGAISMLLIAQFLLIAALIFFVLSLFRNIGNATSNKHNNGLAWAIICLVFSTVAVIFLATAGKLVLAETGSASYKADLVRPILLIVFSAANLAAAIVGKVLRSKDTVSDED